MLDEKHTTLPQPQQRHKQLQFWQHQQEQQCHRRLFKFGKCAATPLSTQTINTQTKMNSLKLKQSPLGLAAACQ
jgi:hypothetical protein